MVAKQAHVVKYVRKIYNLFIYFHTFVVVPAEKTDATLVEVASTGLVIGASGLAVDSPLTGLDR